jgi:hypothetical protein
MAAIWKYRFDVIPACACPTATADVPYQECSEDELLKIRVWDRSQVDVTCFDAVGKRTKSWSDDIVTWSVVEGSSIDVIYQGDRIEWISVYLDMRGSYTICLLPLVRIANAHKWLFLIESKRCFPPSAEAMEAIIQNSLAYKYVHDPVGALKGLKR